MAKLLIMNLFSLSAAVTDIITKDVAIANHLVHYNHLHAR